MSSGFAEPGSNTIPVLAEQSQKAGIGNAFATGFEFIDANGGGPGVRLKKRQQKKPREQSSRLFYGRGLRLGARFGRTKPNFHRMPFWQTSLVSFQREFRRRMSTGENGGPLSTDSGLLHAAFTACSALEAQNQPYSGDQPWRLTKSGRTSLDVRAKIGGAALTRALNRKKRL